ncbi:hypothetical protein [Chitinophaga barathri]|uniref:Uncharacterized protein n=1 Tax=Chitinophaga barathri TaxID=1647451 RepID=A0A3N4MHP3_9BACT|nr:hypothetical protein [Chitinophaga barathri]RPD41277.1 hypothetical protein EG028_11410 [Chitinophaga barathri]
MSEIFSQILREASERHEFVLNKLVQDVQELNKQNVNLEKLSGKMESLESALHVSSIKAGSIEAEQRQLRIAIDGLKQELSKPLPHEHHHYIPKVLWIAAGLLLALSVVLACWYNTGQKLNDLRASDIKYRFLHLQHDKALLLWIYKADSLLQARPDSMRDAVSAKEQEQQRRRGLLEEAVRKEADAEELRRRANE